MGIGGMATGATAIGVIGAITIMATITTTTAIITMATITTTVITITTVATSTTSDLLDAGGVLRAADVESAHISADAMLKWSSTERSGSTSHFRRSSRTDRASCEAENWSRILPRSRWSAAFDKGIE